MSSESSKRNATNPAKKAKDDVVAKPKKLQKALIYLFTQNGFAARNIPHEAADEVAVEDITSNEHFSKQFSAEDFDRAIAKDIHDVILKEEPHFMLNTTNGRKTVKYFKDGLQYQANADAVQLKARASSEVSEEIAAEEEVVNEEEEGGCEKIEETEQKNDSATGGNKKKRNKKKKAASGGALVGSNNLQSKKDADESLLPNVPVAKEASVPVKPGTTTDKASKDKGKRQNEAADSNAKSQPSKETKARDNSAKSASETKDQIIDDNSELSPDGGAFISASSKKSSKKKENRSEALETKNSGKELKQNQNGKQPEELEKTGKQTEKSPEKGGKQIDDLQGKAGKQTEKSPEKGEKQTEDLQGKAGKQTEKSPEKGGKQTEDLHGKAGKQTEKSPEKGGKQTLEQKSTESKQKNPEKQKTENPSDTEKSQKKVQDDVNSAALSSDEGKTPASPEGPPNKKQKKKAEDRLKKIPKTFEFLFGPKGGLKEKAIQVRDDGFVEVKSIVEVYHDQYQWTEEEIRDALDNHKDYIFKQDGTDGLSVKSTAEQKSEVVHQPVGVDEPGNDDSWKETSKRKGQDDRRQRPAQNQAPGRSAPFGPTTPEKLRGTLFWVLGKEGASKHSVQFQSGKRLYVEEMIEKVPALHQVSVSDIKAAAESDPRKEFVLDEVNGHTTIRLQENRAPRDRNTDFPGKSDFHLSKTMSFLLRHGAERLKLPIQSDGFMFVEDLLSCKDLRSSYKEEDVRRVVRENDKQRFLLAEESQTGRLKVRANQGHTFVVPDLELQPITSASDTPTVVHGTYHEYWKVIQKQGLSRMSRNHIHFAPGEPGSDGVISGMRGSCEVLIYIDLEKALNDGLKFFRSANNVILSPGDDKGIVAPKYFQAAVQRSPRVKLL